MNSSELRNGVFAATLTAFLRARAMRCTTERYMVLASALALKGHFTAENLAERLNADGRHVALATVYGTLPLLVECGILKTFDISGGARLYEVSSSVHHHLVCNRCGKIKDVRDTALDDLLRAKRYSAFTPHSFSITAYGICSACARKARKAETQTTKKIIVKH